MSLLGTVLTALPEPLLASKRPLQVSLQAYALLRSALYQAEGLLGPAIDLAVNRRRPRLPIDDPDLFQAARAELFKLFKEDTQRITDGLYPVEVLAPENPLHHMLRLPTMFREGFAIARRRRKHEAHRFSAKAEDLLSGLPEYYQRNFHYQGDGYLSEQSAELYDHQVDVLFVGAADAMRRLILRPLRERFGMGDGEGLTFLELGAGTGRATRFVRLAYPKAKIVAVDLSAPYLKKAQANLTRFARHDFIEGDAAHLPFLDGTFDAAYSVFLFHELPQKERAKVIAESKRVLKPRGFIGFVDSLQIGDRPRLDSALEMFPQEFHEPFYKNYIQHPMEALFEEQGIQKIETETGFFSKAVSGQVR